MFCQRFLFGLSLALVSTLATADWRTGRIRDIYTGYDGLTVTFTINGASKSGCSSYPIWPDRLCLSRARLAFKEEMAMLLSAKAAGSEISVNLDEASCNVTAMGVN